MSRPILEGPETAAIRHFKLHPRHAVEVIQRLIPMTTDLEAVATATYSTRWICHDCKRRNIPGAEIEQEDRAQVEIARLRKELTGS